MAERAGDDQLQAAMGALDVEDILSDALEILGGEMAEDAGYGPLRRLTVAPKVVGSHIGHSVRVADHPILFALHQDGKANTLLADHLFSPALLLAEPVERRGPPSRRPSEAWCRVSLLAATLNQPPSLIIVATDYPDGGILGNLKANVERNEPYYRPSCQVHCVGYEWGTDTTPILRLSKHVDDALPGYDIVIMSDFLHFDSSHGVLVVALSALLAKSPHARVYVAAGNYTAPHVCDSFLKLGTLAGLIWEEKTNERSDDDGEAWLGSMIVSGLDAAQLTARKRMCRWWIGRWGVPVSA